MIAKYYKAFEARLSALLFLLVGKAALLVFAELLRPYSFKALEPCRHYLKLGNVYSITNGREKRIKIGRYYTSGIYTNQLPYIYGRSLATFKDDLRHLLLLNKKSLFLLYEFSLLLKNSIETLFTIDKINSSKIVYNR